MFCLKIIQKNSLTSEVVVNRGLGEIKYQYDLTTQWTWVYLICISFEMLFVVLLSFSSSAEVKDLEHVHSM